VPEDRLCQLGVVVLEALLDLHWAVIGELFEEAALNRPGFDRDSGSLIHAAGLASPS